MTQQHDSPDARASLVDHPVASCGRRGFVFSPRMVPATPFARVAATSRATPRAGVGSIPAGGNMTVIDFMLYFALGLAIGLLMLVLGGLVTMFFISRGKD